MSVNIHFYTFEKPRDTLHLSIFNRSTDKHAFYSITICTGEIEKLSLYGLSSINEPFSLESQNDMSARNLVSFLCITIIVIRTSLQIYSGSFVQKSDIYLYRSIQEYVYRYLILGVKVSGARTTLVSLLYLVLIVQNANGDFG